MVLHAFLVSDGQLTQESLVLLVECHIGAPNARSFLCSGENSRDNGSLDKCHCSVTTDFKYIEILWRLAKGKIDDLGYFATVEMKALDDKRLSLGSEVGGASWVQELFHLRQYFEENMKSQNLKALKQYSDELLRSCRTHLYRIDKRLLDAVKELDHASDFIMRYRI